MMPQISLGQAGRLFRDHLAMPVMVEAIDHGAVETRQLVHLRRGRVADARHVVAGAGDPADRIGEPAVQVFRMARRRSRRFLELQDDAAVMLVRDAAQLALRRCPDEDRDLIVQMGEDRRQVAAGQLPPWYPGRADVTEAAPRALRAAGPAGVAEFALTWAMVQFSGSAESRTPCGWIAPGMWIGSRSQASRSPAGCGVLNPMTQGMAVSWLLVRSFFAASESAAFLKPRSTLSRNDCHHVSQVIESRLAHRCSSRIGYEYTDRIRHSPFGG